MSLTFQQAEKDKWYVTGKEKNASRRSIVPDEGRVLIFEKISHTYTHTQNMYFIQELQVWTKQISGEHFRQSSHSKGCGADMYSECSRTTRDQCSWNREDKEWTTTEIFIWRKKKKKALQVTIDLWLFFREALWMKPVEYFIQQCDIFCFKIITSAAIWIHTRQQCEGSHSHTLQEREWSLEQGGSSKENGKRSVSRHTLRQTLEGLSRPDTELVDKGVRALSNRRNPWKPNSVSSDCSQTHCKTTSTDEKVGNASIKHHCTYCCILAIWEKKSEDLSTKENLSLLTKHSSSG